MVKLAILLPALAFSAMPAPDIGLLQEENRIKRESEEKIQHDVLDPIVGKGNAMAFVTVEMEVKIESEQSTRSGMGLAEKYKERLTGGGQRGGLQTTFVLPGIPKPKTITNPNDKDAGKPESAQAQQAQQIKGVQEERYAIKPVFKRFEVVVIHDDAVLREKTQVDLVRERIVDAMAHYKLGLDQVAFRPTRFNRAKTDWREDLKKPEVYLPLLYALLFLLFLAFLFGPLRKFFSHMVGALMSRKDFNIEHKAKTLTKEELAADTKGQGQEGEEGPDESKVDITWQQKAMELPPPSDGEDEMKKFEPFSYIKEENIKRLAYMFMLRKEEPWVIAVVGSYLRPDFARQLLTSLPVELQAKVAIEALTVRQVTREQVIAIDNDVRENVDFVVGGIERLTAMLDEADTGTRNNILNYLKNEKPMVYEAVRRHVLVFEDCAQFPEREMQVIVRELKTESMARALQGASPEVVNKFFSNMSPGAASLLKESMEYSQNLTEFQIEEERSKILDLVKLLEKEGKISVRGKTDGNADFVAGLQEELGAQKKREEAFQAARRKGGEAAAGAGAPASAAAPAPAADPAQAQAYFEAGVNYYNGGQAAEAIQYFQAALSLNPALWQAHQYLGGLLYQQGRVPEALAHYDKVLEFNPDPQLKAWLDGLKAQAGR